MDFPYGKAPLAILIVALLTGGTLLAINLSTEQARKPDLVLATFDKDQAAIYAAALPEFEKKHNCKVQVQLVDQRAIIYRLQSAMQVGAEVPDLAEVIYYGMGSFVRGPIEDVGFADLTERLHTSGMWDRILNSRFRMWSSRGHVFALPHDVHPVMLVYRKDLIEQEGIDVRELDTWDKFVKVGRRVTRDRDGDGNIDRYMLDLQTQAGDYLRLLMNQRGTDVFDDQGEVAFDNETVVDTVCWYIKAIEGKDRIAFPAGWGQTLSRAMIDGLCLFYICPDWRTRQIKIDIPSLEGKLALMPLPAWEPGGRRTSTWGGSGLGISKQCQEKGKFDLAWELAMYLYYDPPQLEQRFLQTHIIPPLKESWKMPGFDKPFDYYGGIPLGRTYIDLAPQVPSVQTHAFQTMAQGKLSMGYEAALIYYKQHGDDGLRDFVRKELKTQADAARVVVARNPFLRASKPMAQSGAQPAEVAR